jgi:hypothetical protein
VELHVQREGRPARRRRGAADGEVGAVPEVRAQSLEVRAQVRRVQALTCRSRHTTFSLQKSPKVMNRRSLGAEGSS